MNRLAVLTEFNMPIPDITSVEVGDFLCLDPKWDNHTTHLLRKVERVKKGNSQTGTMFLVKINSNTKDWLDADWFTQHIKGNQP